VGSLKDLKDPETGEYYTGVVNVTGDVDLFNEKLLKLPVKFGTVVGRWSNRYSDFDCSNNQLTSLQGAPSSVSGDFACSNNQLTSLQGAPSSVSGDFYCDNNQLTSLQGVHKIIMTLNGDFDCQGNPITSGGIGLLLIEGLTGITADQPAFDIIEKYLGQGKKGLLLCQDELIEAGYEEYTRL
jgi:hypothetical protein